MSATESIVRGLLSPKSLAIIGASDDPAKASGRPLSYLRRAGWAGRIYPINPRRDTVQGEPAWPSLADLPETPDHALILVPTEGVRDAVQACADVGVAVASILAGGFSEAGDFALQDEVVHIARAGGVRLLGPSSLGYADPRRGLILTANAAFADPDLPPGRLFAASHSGSMIGALASRGAAKGIGFAGLVSVGLEADLSLGQICEAALEDTAIDGFLLFLESLRNADAMRRFALMAADAGKPVVAYKLGRSPQAAELAQSHTGALAGEDRVADAFFEACGIVRVDTLDGLLEAPALVRRLIDAGRRRATSVVGVVATTGGGGAMVVDQLGVRGVEVRNPSEDTLVRLAAAKVEVQPGRIVDLTLAGTQYTVMKAALDVMTSAPEFDLVIAVAGSSARFQPEDAVQPAIDSRDAGTPLAVFATPEAPQALARLAEAGVPAFRTPESCADVVAAALRRRAPTPWRAPPTLTAGADHSLDEAEAYGRLQCRGIDIAAFVVTDISTAESATVEFPAAVKILSAALPHKTDSGGVVLNVSNSAGLAAAAKDVAANVERAHPELKPSRVLIQTMARGVGEVLIGFRRDDDVGPIVMLAPGGVLAELGDERSLRLAPVTEEEALDMIGEVKALRALAGFRNRMAGDMSALARAIVALSHFADEADVIEAEINPLIVRPVGQGAVAVDALVRVRKESRS